MRTDCKWCWILIFGIHFFAIMTCCIYSIASFLTQCYATKNPLRADLWCSVVWFFCLMHLHTHTHTQLYYSHYRWSNKSLLLLKSTPWIMFCMRLKNKPSRTIGIHNHRDERLLTIERWVINTVTLYGIGYQYTFLCMLSIIILTCLFHHCALFLSFLLPSLHYS